MSSLGDLLVALLGWLARGLPGVAARAWMPRHRLQSRLLSLEESLEGLASAVDAAHGQLHAVQGQMAAVHEQLSDVLTDTKWLRTKNETSTGELRQVLIRQEALLRALAAEESANRRRLWELRESPEYEKAFQENEPLVTVAIVTRDRPGLLLERSLPSILRQGYERLEVLIIGDNASPDTVTAIQSVRDPRIRFLNVATRVVRQPRQMHWLAAKTLPIGEAYGEARGRWMLEFDDDDVLLPDAISALLGLARAEHAEIAYGQIRQLSPDGGVSMLGAFPPICGQFSLCAAVVHSGLRFFAREFHAADLGLPGDWYRAERMVRAGARFVYLPHNVVDYYPSLFWSPQGEL
jgi:hypothetical protein